MYMYFFAQINFADLHINSSSKPPTRSSLLGPYSEVVLSKSKTYDDKKTGSLKVIIFIYGYQVYCVYAVGNICISCTSGRF